MHTPSLGLRSFGPYAYYLNSQSLSFLILGLLFGLCCDNLCKMFVTMFETNVVSAQQLGISLLLILVSR